MDDDWFIKTAGGDTENILNKVAHDIAEKLKIFVKFVESNWNAVK